jgi:hypothetical protein
MESQSADIYNIIFDQLDTLTSISMQTTCKHFQRIIKSKIKSYNDNLELAINILNTECPDKFFQYFPHIQNEFLVLAIGCIGNRHNWTIICDFGYNIRTEFSSFLVKNFRLICLVDMLNDPLQIYNCIRNINDLFSTLSQTDDFFWNTCFEETNNFNMDICLNNKWKNIYRTIQKYINMDYIDEIDD